MSQIALLTQPQNEAPFSQQSASSTFVGRKIVPVSHGETPCVPKVIAILGITLFVIGIILWVVGAKVSLPPVGLAGKIAFGVGLTATLFGFLCHKRLSRTPEVEQPQQFDIQTDYDPQD